MGTMNIAVINALWSIFTGEKLQIEDPNQKKVVTQISNFVVSVSMSGNSRVALILPRSMTKWPILDQLSGYRLIKEAVESMRNLISPHIDYHERTLTSTRVRDFLDVLLLEHQAKKSSDSCFSSKLGKSTIVNTLMDLFIAGMETTSSSLVMAILHLLHHPDVQSKVQAELDKVCSYIRSTTN
jgi:cytochrome P450